MVRDTPCPNARRPGWASMVAPPPYWNGNLTRMRTASSYRRSEEHTSELQSRLQLVCRLLLEKKTNKDEPEREHAPTSSGRAHDQVRTRAAPPLALACRCRVHRFPLSSCRLAVFFLFLMIRQPPRPPLFPSTPLSV